MTETAVPRPRRKAHMSDAIGVIAHRGASGLTGEDNTLRSFAVAIEMKCDYVEFDVRRVRDALVCYHDPAVGGKPIAHLTLDELRTRAGMAIPTLQEVLQLCRGRIGLDVEIKVPDVEAEVVADLRAVQDDGPVLIKSFDTSVVARLAAMGPGYPVGLLVGRVSRRAPAAALKAAVLACEELHADFLSPHYSLLRDAAAASTSLRRIPAYPWTVNDPALMTRLLLLPIRGLITDRPDLLLALPR